MKGKIYWIPLWILCFWTVGCQDLPTTETKPLILLISREPDVFTSFFMKQGVSLLVHKALFRGLVEYNDQLEAIPSVAQFVPTIENGAVRITEDQKMEVLWTLKTNIKWSDGHPLSFEDIFFTYEVLNDPKVSSFGLEKTAVKEIETIEKTQDGFRVLWKKPYYNYLIAHPILPRHILEKSYRESPETFEQLKYHRFPIGNGPYKIRKWEAGSSIILDTNPHFEKVPQIPQIAFQILPDLNSLIIKLLSEEGDASTILTPEQYKYLKEKKDSPIKVHTTQGMGWLHVDLNTEDSILSDQRVRQALLYGIDRQAIAQAVSEGTLQVADSWLPKKHPGYNKPSIQYSYNPEKAKKLLKEAGWKKENKENDDSILQKQGQKLSLTLITDSKDKNRFRMAVFMKENLKKLGIKIHIKTYPTEVLFSEFLFQRKFQMALYAWYMQASVDGESYWKSDQIPSGKRRGLNFTGFQNSKIDSIHEELSQTLSAKKRKELFLAHQEIWMEELPALPLFVTLSLSTTRKGLLEWKPTGSAIPVTWNCEDWRWETP